MSYLLLLTAALAVTVSHSDRSTWTLNFFVWCAWYVAICPVIAWGTNLATRAYVNAGEVIDGCLDSKIAKVDYERWAGFWLRTRNQLAATGLIAILGPIMLYFASIADQGPQEAVLFDWPSYLILFLAGYLTAAAAYWIMSAVALLYLFERSGAISTVLEVPALTPGIEEFARIAGATFLAATGYVLYLLFPFGYWLSSLPGVFDDSDELLLLLIRMVTLGLTAGVVISAGLTPQLVLTRVIRDSRSKSLHQALQRLEASRGGDAQEWRHARDDFVVVANSPSSTLGLINATQLAFGVAIAIVPAFFVLVI